MSSYYEDFCFFVSSKGVIFIFEVLFIYLGIVSGYCKYLDGFFISLRCLLVGICILY